METLTRQSESNRFFLDNIEARKRVLAGDADALRISAIQEAPIRATPSRAIPLPDQVAQAPLTADAYINKYAPELSSDNSPEKRIINTPEDYIKKYAPELYVEPVLQREQINVNKKRSDSQGFFSGLGSSVLQGTQDTGGLIYAAGATYGGANNAVVDSAKAAGLREKNSEALAMKEFKQDFQKRKQLDDSVLGGISNVAGAVYDNPEGALQLIASQIPNMAVAFAPAITLGKLGALGGAALGGPAAPITATIGGIGGFLTGLFVGYTALETGGYAQEAAGDGTFTNIERDESIVKGAKKGLVLATVDAATLGLSKYLLGTAGRAIERATVSSLKAGGIDTVQAVAAIKDAQRVALNATASQGRELSVAAIEKATYETMVKQGLTNPVLVNSVRAAQDAAKQSVNTIAKRIGRGGAAIGLETLGEGLGEYLGELAATGKASPSEAILEAFSSLGMSVAELIVPTPLDTSRGQLTSLIDRNVSSQSTSLQNQNTNVPPGDPLRTEVDDTRSLEAKINIEDGYKKHPENVINILSAIASSLSNSAEDKIILQNIDRTAARLGFIDKLNLALGNGRVLTEAQTAGNQFLSNNPTMRSAVIAAVNDYGNLVPPRGKPKQDKRPLMVDSTSESDPDSFNLSNEEDTLYGFEGSGLKTIPSSAASHVEQLTQEELASSDSQLDRLGLDKDWKIGNLTNSSFSEDFLSEKRRRAAFLQSVADKLDGLKPIPDSELEKIRRNASATHLKIRSGGIKTLSDSEIDSMKLAMPQLSSELDRLKLSIARTSAIGRSPGLTAEELHADQEASAVDAQREIDQFPLDADENIDLEARTFNFQNYVAETVNRRRSNNGQSSIAATSIVDTTNKLPSGLKTIADLFSIDLYGFDTSDKNENQKITLKGFSDTASNKIFLNTASLKNINGLFILGHEIFHQFENINPVFAKELSSSIVSFLKNNYAQYAEGLTKNGYSLDQVDSEISGDVLGVVFNDAAYWRGLRTYNPSLFEKVKIILDDFVAKVRNFITVDGGKKAANKKYGRAANLKAYLSDYETVRNLMAQASVDFIKQTRPSANLKSGPAKFMSDSNAPKSKFVMDAWNDKFRKIGRIVRAAQKIGNPKEIAEYQIYRDLIKEGIKRFNFSSDNIQFIDWKNKKADEELARKNKVLLQNVVPESQEEQNTFEDSGQAKLIVKPSPKVESDELNRTQSDEEIIWEKRFREISGRVEAAEKISNYEDWTTEERRAWESKDWKVFSKARGYTNEEIAEYQTYQDLIIEGQVKFGLTLDDIQSLEHFPEAKILKDEKAPPENFSDDDAKHLGRPDWIHSVDRAQDSEDYDTPDDAAGQQRPGQGEDDDSWVTQLITAHVQTINEVKDNIKRGSISAAAKLFAAENIFAKTGIDFNSLLTGKETDAQMIGRIADRFGVPLTDLQKPSPLSAKATPVKKDAQLGASFSRSQTQKRKAGGALASVIAEDNEKRRTTEADNIGGLTYTADARTKAQILNQKVEELQKQYDSNQDGFENRKKQTVKLSPKVEADFLNRQTELQRQINSIKFLDALDSIKNEAANMLLEHYADNIKEITDLISKKEISEAADLFSTNKIHKKTGINFNDLLKSAAPPSAAKVILTGIPGREQHLAKDQLKSDKANKFIGRGSPKSSTAQYAKDWGANANTGNYTASDIVFVSAEGLRKERLPVDTDELGAAVTARATIITDPVVTPYNVGEGEIKNFLQKNGYDQSSPGTWTSIFLKAKQDPQNTLTNTIENLQKKYDTNVANFETFRKKSNPSAAAIQKFFEGQVEIQRQIDSAKNELNKKKESSSITALRKVFDGIIDSFTKRSFHQDSISNLENLIKEIDEKITNLDTLSVGEDKDGKQIITDFKLKYENIDLGGYGSSTYSTEVSFDSAGKDISGIIYDQPTAKRDLLNQRYQLTELLANARVDSANGRAFRYKISAARMSEIFGDRLRLAVASGVNREAAVAIYYGYMNAINIWGNFDASINAEKQIKFLEAMKKTEENLRKGQNQEVVEEAEIPDDSRVIDKLITDIKSQAITVQEAFDIVNEIADGDHIKAKSWITTILISLVKDSRMTDTEKSSINIDNLVTIAIRNKMIGLNTFYDVLAMNQIDVTNQNRLHGQIALQHKLADYLSANNNSYTAQEYWMRSMENVLDQDPTKKSSFTKSEQDEFKDWKKATDALANRRNVNNQTKLGQSIEEAFPNLLFTNNTLSSMRDVSLLDESDRLILTRFMPAESLPDRFFSDIAFAITTRPDLENEILKKHLSQNEKLEYQTWIENKRKQVDLDVEMTLRIPFLRELLNLVFLTDEEIFGAGNTSSNRYATNNRGIIEQVVRASITDLPAIFEQARQLNLVSMEKIRTGGNLKNNKNLYITEDAVIARKNQDQIDFEFNEIINNLTGQTDNAIYRTDNVESLSQDKADDQQEAVFNPQASIFENREELAKEDAADADADIDDDDVRARQGIFDGRLTNRLVQVYTAKITSRWKNKPHIVVLSNHLQLPAELRDRVIQKLKEGTGAKGLYDTRTGIAYIFSNYMASEADIQFTIFHEVYGHLGMRAFMGSNFDKFLSDMYQSNSKVRQAVDRRMADGGIAKLEAIDEVIAEISEQDIQSSLATHYTGMLIAGLRKIGLDFVANFIGNMTSAELFYSLAMAKSTAQNGGYYSPLKNAPTDIRFAEKQLPYEIVAIKGKNTKAFARYNPLQNEWYLFTATGDDIRGSTTEKTFESYDDLLSEMSTLGKLESRVRSGAYRDNKISVDFPKFEQSREMTGFKKLGQSLIRAVQNQYKPLFRVVAQMEEEGRVTFKNKDGSLNTSLDLRIDARLWERITAVKVEDGNKKYTIPIYRLVDQAKKDGGKFDFEATNTDEMLNKYLLATHAEERNKTIANIKGNENFTNGSGMTTETANDIKQFVRQQPYAKRFFDIAQLLNNMSIDKVNNEINTGLISEKEGDKRKTAYANYRNLSGPGRNLDLDHSSDPTLSIGRKFNAGRGKDKRALGRGDEAQNILVMTLLGYQASLIKGQKNLFQQKVLNFFETNYDPNFISINEQSVTRSIGEDGFIQLADNEHYFNQEDVMVVRLRGIPITMRFKDSGFNSVREAIHGSVIPQDQQNQVLFMIGQWTKLTGQFFTTYNPYWIPVNFIKDITTLFLNAAVNGTIKTNMAGQMLMKVLPYAMTAFRATVMDLQPSSDKGKLAQKAILSLMNTGPFKESAKKRLNIYNEARLNGALTSFINRKDLETALIDLNEAMTGKSVTSHLHGILKFMQLLTIPLEMAPRLAAYEVMKNDGRTIRESADYAGKVTVDFNMRGSNELVRQIYIFFGAAIQGTAGMYDLYKNNPKRFAVVVGLMFTLGLFTGAITRALEGDDDDDKKKRPIKTVDQISVSKRATTLMFAPNQPWGAIPLPYGWNFPYAAGLFFSDSLFGKTPIHVSVSRTIKAGIEAFSPVGGQAFDVKDLPSDPLNQTLNLIMPFVLMPMYQWAINTNRHGGPIYRDSEVLSRTGGDSDTTKAFNSVNPIAKDFAVELQTLTGGDRFNTKGIDINPAIIDHFIHAYAPGVASLVYDMAGQAIQKSRGFDIPREKSPFTDRFSGFVPESVEASQFRRVSEEVNAAYRELKRRPLSDPRREEILQEHPNLAAAQTAIDISNKLIRDLRHSSNLLEEDAYQYRRAGKKELADKKQKEYVAFVNKQRAAEKLIYDRATRAFIKAGFEPLLVSND